VDDAMLQTTRASNPPQAVAPPATGAAAAEVMQPVFTALFTGPPPVRFEFWDGSAAGPLDGPGVVYVRSGDALRSLMWSPGELGLGRAFLLGQIDFDGEPLDVIRALKNAMPKDLRFAKAVPAAMGAARRLGIDLRPLPVPAEEARPGGRRHSKRRDARAISHHYDVGNHFYELILGPSMTYSCARFATAETTLEEAQTAKHDLICHKLGLPDRPGARLLDVGCGWGSLAIHAAGRYDAQVVGITISEEQARLARERVEKAGLSELVEIRLQDYRTLGGERFDAISSVGMFEHVGAKRIASYFETLHGLLEPGGRLLNHAISAVGGSALSRRSFMGRYVFPDGELIDVGDVVLAMEAAGFEVRDVEGLREHYARTLQAWLDNLSAHWDEAVAEVGEHRARVWRLYMTGSALGFTDGGIGVHQVLGVVRDARGGSGMPPTRDGWVV
jgi:cyclopropane-fatty-acyl-phospholipid synthase